MKNLKTVTLLAFLATSSALAAVPTKSQTSTTGLGSNSPSSVLGKNELSAQAGVTFASKMTAGVVQSKVSYRLDVRQAPVYFEAGLGVVANSDRVFIPLDLGTRVSFSLNDMPKLKPHLHLSAGPAIATEGAKLRYHMFVGPGFMYRLDQQMDTRVDLGLAMFGGRAAFQLVGGIAL